MKLLRYPFKVWRAAALRQIYSYYTGQVVCFTSGNASAALADEGFDVITIGDKSVKGACLSPNMWFKPHNVKKVFPTMLDLTSGHLDVGTMELIGLYYKSCLDLWGGEIEDDIVYVPTGSGETLVSLALAYPDKKFVAVYNLDDHTKYDKNAPLNRLVEKLAYDIIMEGEKHEFDN